MFMRYAGMSGILFVLFLIVSGVAFSPYNGGHWLLWVEWGLVFVLWQFSRWEREIAVWLKRRRT